MFDFIRKPFLWEAWDRGLDKAIGTTGKFHLKSIQDLAVYDYLKDLENTVVGEIGGGNSRVLPALSAKNRCYNIERFAGSDGGPNKEVKIPGVTNLKVFVGEFSPEISDEMFDILFSISVVEHINDLTSFFKDGLRILKPGGIWLHAIDLYVQDQPDAHHTSRFEEYRNWVNGEFLVPLGNVYDGPLRFTCDLATNPDNVMYSWGRIAPSLIPLRQRAQSVSLLVGGRKPKRKL